MMIERRSGLAGPSRWRLLGIVVAAVSLTAAHPGSHDEQPTSPPAEHANHDAASTPVGTVTAFHAALASGNTAAALDLLAEEVLIFETGGVESSRAEYASHHLAADAAFSAAAARTLVSRSHGEAGDTAWVMSVETVTGSYRGRAINSRSVETILLRRTDGQWRIIHIHWSSINIGQTRP